MMTHHPQKIDFTIHDHGSFFQIDHQLIPDQSLKYYFEADEIRTELKELDVLHRPKIKKVDLAIIPPSYTRQEARTLSHIPQYVRVLEGSQVELKYEFDKRIEKAQLKAIDESQRGLASSVEIDDMGTVPFHLKQNRIFHLNRFL